MIINLVRLITELFRFDNLIKQGKISIHENEPFHSKLLFHFIHPQIVFLSWLVF